MIGTLTGVIEEVTKDYVILNVGGVGYIVYISAKNSGLCSIGKAIKFLIDVHGQKDKPDQLYGFVDKVEQNCLRMLVKVSGISYKTAMSILGKLSPEQVWSAIANQDKMALKISGLGPRLIDRIITELHKEVERMNMPKCSPIAEDALFGLVSLGYDKLKAYGVVKSIKTNFPDLDTQGIIRKALLELS